MTDSIIEKLANEAVATIHEAIGEKNAMNYDIKPLDRSMKLCGRALTVKCAPNDNLMIIKAVSMAKPGDVLVVDAGDNRNSGPFGEVLTVNCQARGIKGLVTSGSVRDSLAIIDRSFPVFSAGISVQGTYKHALGTINEPVTVGGVVVKPGDYVLGDADGVVTIDPKEVEQAIEAADAREAKEARVMERLATGEEDLLDIYGYQKALDELGYQE